MKLKKPEEILKKILYKYFMEDLKNGNLCASDSIWWISNNEDRLAKLFDEWLVNQGYADNADDVDDVYVGDYVYVGDPANKEQTEFDVYLLEVGNYKLQVIKTIKELLELGLIDAKELTDSVPCILKEKVTKSEAKYLKEQFENIGAIIDIR